MSEVVYFCKKRHEKLSEDEVKKNKCKDSQRRHKCTSNHRLGSCPYIRITGISGKAWSENQRMQQLAWEETKRIYQEATQTDCRFCHARKCDGCHNEKHLDPKYQ